jgi:AcrR family transcriptional regulator
MADAAARGREAVVAPPQEDGRTRILAAALEVFSTSGFEGASLRQIADRAGVQHQLVVYHFKTKDALWKAAVSSFFEEDVDAMRARLARHRAEGPAAALRELVREFVHFTARRPEYHRIATFEGRTDGERLRWLLEEHVKPFYELSVELIRTAQAAGEARAGDPGQLHYAMIGLVTTGFVFAPEYRRLTGIDAFAPEEIEKVIGLTCDFLGIAGPCGRADK